MTLEKIESINMQILLFCKTQTTQQDVSCSKRSFLTSCVLQALSFQITYMLATYWLATKVAVKSQSHVCKTLISNILDSVKK